MKLIKKVQAEPTFNVQLTRWEVIAIEAALDMLDNDEEGDTLKWFGIYDDEYDAEQVSELHNSFYYLRDTVSE